MKTVDTIISEFDTLRDKTVSFAIKNEAYLEEALSLYKDFNDNFEAISEHYRIQFFYNELDSYLNNWD